MMWILILVICCLPVSDALWAEKKITGILGRAITINCHYDAQKFSTNIKYWCKGSNHGCSYLVRTDDPDGRRKRMSITDNNSQGKFMVTMENLQSSDARWYSCGIDKFGLDELFSVELQIIDESVSVPEVRFLSPPNASCSGGSVSIFCESVQESLSIQYTWHEKTPSEDSKISDTNELDLHCQSFTQQQHQYYCTVSNNQGEKSSEMVNVSVINRSENDCSYEIEVSSIRPEYSCPDSSTVSTNTNILPTESQDQTSQSTSLIYIVLAVLGVILIMFAVSLLLYLKKINKETNGNEFHRKDKTLNDNRQLEAAEESTVYANINAIQSMSTGAHNEGNLQFNNNQSKVAYAAVLFQKESPVLSGEVETHSVNNTDTTTYSMISIQNQPNKNAPSVSNPQDSQMTVYATVNC